MKPRLYLIDAHSYLHRAYHALPPLSNSKGEPVGALYGYLRMLLALIKKESADHAAVCFDLPGPTFRHKLYPEYKATRKKPDEDLVFQLKEARPLTKALGLPCVEAAGYEADDLMATLAQRAVKEGFEAVLVTADKDALQLVGPGVRVLKDVTSGAWMDPPQIKDKFGVEPKQIVDYLALVGDSSDNVPGVAGIGPTGAAKILGRYGDLEKAISAAKASDSALAPKAASALISGEQNVLRAKSLIVLEKDAPVGIDPKDCRISAPEPAALVPILERYEFKSLLKELVPQSAAALESSARNGAPPQAGPAWREVSFAEFEKAAAKNHAIYVSAFSHPQKDLADGALLHLALGLEDGRACVLDEGLARKDKKPLAGILTGPAVKAGHDVKKILEALEPAGLELTEPIFDTLLAAYCLNPVRSQLAIQESGEWRQDLLGRLSRASAWREDQKKMREVGVFKLYEDVELPLVLILRRMEREGILLDVPFLKKLQEEFDGRIQGLAKELEELAGYAFNVNSPKQLGELLYDKLQLPVLHKTAKGGRSTDEESLTLLAGKHPIPAKILEYREFAKLKSTYIDGLLLKLDPDTGRVHTHFDQTGSETGRLSSVNPNLQNIPVRSEAGQKIRRAFIAKKGCELVSADYSQIDLRVLAHVSKDAVLCESFKNGEDVHLRTACEIFHAAPEAVDKEMRRRAKAVNFGIVYGQTAFGLSTGLGIPQKEAALIIQKYFERYQGVAAWLKTNLDEARANGFVRTFLGRLRPLPDIAAKNTAARLFSERIASNTPIQGGSADIIKVAMIKIGHELAKGRFKAAMLLQIHDELLFEVPKAEMKAFVPWVREEMEEAVRLDVPLEVDVKAGANWADMEPVEP